MTCSSVYMQIPTHEYFSPGVILCPAFFFFLILTYQYIFIDFRGEGCWGGRRLERERERAKHQCEKETWIGCLLYSPLRVEPRYVP